MRSVIISTVALIELLIFAILCNAASQIFSVFGAITFMVTVGAIAVAVILGIVGLFRAYDRRAFFNEFNTAVTLKGNHAQ